MHCIIKVIENNIDRIEKFRVMGNGWNENV